MRWLTAVLFILGGGMLAYSDYSYHERLETELFRADALAERAAVAIEQCTQDLESGLYVARDFVADADVVEMLERLEGSGWERSDENAVRLHWIQSGQPWLTNE